MNRFSKLLTIGFLRKYYMHLLQEFPLHLKYVTKVPREIWILKIATEFALIIQSEVNRTRWQIYSFFHQRAVLQCSFVAINWRTWLTAVVTSTSGFAARPGRRTAGPSSARPFAGASWIPVTWYPSLPRPAASRCVHCAGLRSSMTHDIGTVTDIPDQPYDLYIYRFC